MSLGEAIEGLLESSETLCGSMWRQEEGGAIGCLRVELIDDLSRATSALRDALAKPIGTQPECAGSILEYVTIIVNAVRFYPREMMLVDRMNTWQFVDVEPFVSVISVCAGLTNEQLQVLADAGGIAKIIEALVYLRGSDPECEHDARNVLDGITDKWMELHRGELT